MQACGHHNNKDIECQDSTMKLVTAAAVVVLRVSLHWAGNKPSVKVAKPRAVIPGLPPIKQFAILADRRYILTQDAEGSVEVWDMTTAGVVRSYGKV